MFQKSTFMLNQALKQPKLHQTHSTYKLQRILTFNSLLSFSPGKCPFATISTNRAQATPNQDRKVDATEKEKLKIETSIMEVMIDQNPPTQEGPFPPHFHNAHELQYFSGRRTYGLSLWLDSRICGAGVKISTSIMCSHWAV